MVLIPIPGIFTHNIPGIGIGINTGISPIPIPLPGIGGTLPPGHPSSEINVISG